MAATSVVLVLLLAVTSQQAYSLQETLALQQDQDLITQVVWGKDSGETWTFESSDDVGDVGQSFADPDFDDSEWGTSDFQYSANPGSGFANYFRKEFTIEDLYRVEAIELEFQYDDAAILYLNGTEVYRTIRGNLPPAPEPVPADITVPFGGFENQYIEIPGLNSCQQGCNADTFVPAVDSDLLVEGSNTWAIALWNRTNSGDMSTDLEFRLVIDRNAQPPGPCVEPPADQTNQLADVVSIELELTCSNGPVSWEATGLPAGLTIDDRGVIAGQLTEIMVSDVVVTAADDQAATELSFEWAVTNALPVVENPGPQQTASFEQVGLQLVVDDPDGGEPVIAISGLPPGLSMSPTGLISGSSSDEGGYNVTVMVTDDEGDSVEVSFAWQIAEPPITLESPGPITTPFGEAVNLAIVAIDPAGGDVALVASGLPAGLTLDAQTNSIVGQPEAVGVFVILIEGTGPSGRAIISFEWTIPNEPPNIAALADQLALEGIAASVQAAAVDPDGGPIVYGANGLPSGISVDAATGLLSGVPTDNGAFTVSVIATDDEGGRTTLDFTWQVEPAISSPIVINELVASNDESLLDEDGDSPDWIELHNVAPVPFDLDGWLIEDSTTSWVFPAITMAPGDFLVIFASDKDRRNPNNPLHTNFKISKEADSLTLIDAGGFVIDELGDDGLPPQFSDVSFGRSSAGEIFYLATATPGAPNSPAGSEYEPVLRPFTDRLYNFGEPVNQQIDAFDPDGGPLSYSMVPLPPGLQIDITSGEITGTPANPGRFDTEILVIDVEGKRQSQTVRWIFAAPPEAAPGLIMNEYNAVPPPGFLVAGEDLAFGLVEGNGGDWFEFVVVEENLDLRGWTIELWDRDSGDALLANSANLKFAQRPELAGLAAGTIITVSQDRVDDLSFDPAAGDWHINLQSNDADEGDFFTPGTQEDFNSSRANQNVVIRNADGDAVTPVVGETELWDELVGGVGDGEVMTYCADPRPVQINPISDYLDNPEFSTYGQPNTCRFLNDPIDPDDDVLFTQDLEGLRVRSTPVGVSVAASCVAENGRIEFVIRNGTGVSIEVELSVSRLAPRTRTIAAHSTVVAAITGRPDGDYDLVATSGDQTLLADTAEIKCDPAVKVSCLGGNGRIDVRIENTTAAQRSYVVMIGALRRTRSVGAGDSSVVTVTGRSDSSLAVTVSTSGVVISAATAEVDCDPDVEVATSIVCFDQNGRVDVELTNYTDRAITYIVTIGTLVPRVRVVDAHAAGRVSVSGRPDGSLAVSVERDGAGIFARTLDVGCDANANFDPVAVTVMCLGENGKLVVELFNDTAAPASYQIRVGRLTRTAMLGAGAHGSETITGRPDGAIPVLVSRNNLVIYNEALAVGCDARDE